MLGKSSLTLFELGIRRRRKYKYIIWLRKKRLIILYVVGYLFSIRKWRYKNRYYSLDIVVSL